MQENGYRYSGIEGCDYEPHYKYTLLIKNTTIANLLLMYRRFIVS